jgi:hypothetical protein
MLTSFPSKHILEAWQNERTHMRSRCRNLELAREARPEQPSLLPSSEGKSLRRRPKFGGPKKKPPNLPDHRRGNCTKRKLPMTICAGALCKYQGNDAVVVISDRMMTSGDIEYPGHPKIYLLESPQSFFLSAGVIDLARMIFDDMKRHLDETQG